MSIDVRSNIVDEVLRNPLLLKKVTRSDVSLRCCDSEICLLKEISIEDFEIIPLSVSEKINIGLLNRAQKKLYVPLSEKKWKESHLYGIEINRDIESKTNCLKILKETHHENLANILNYCSCTIEMKYIEGKLLDVNIWNGISIKNAFDSKHSIKDFDEFRKIMISLLEGLIFLHSRGVAHTDPIPSNAIVDVNGDVFWIDLDDSVQLTPEMLNLDIVVFYNFTWLVLLSQLEYYDTSLIQKIDEIYCECESNQKILNEMLHILKVYERKSELNINTRKLVPIAKSNTSERLNLTRAILSRSLTFYKNTTLDSLFHSKTLEGLLKSEIHRHILFVREFEKTQMEREKWFKEVEHGKEWLEQEWKAWKNNAEKLIKEKEYLEHERDLWKTQAEELEKEKNIIEENYVQLHQLNSSLVEVEKLNEELEKNSEMAEEIEQLNYDIKKMENNKWVKLGRKWGFIK